MWRYYPALYDVFCSDTKLLGMGARMPYKYFIYVLALMLDILQERYLLSNALQTRSVSLPMAEKIIKRTIKAFEMPKKGTGQHEEKKVDVKLAHDNFKNIGFFF